MLIRRVKEELGDSDQWFAWHPVRAQGVTGRPGGWVWLERVHRDKWDCWGAGGCNYRRIVYPARYGLPEWGEEHRAPSVADPLG